MIWVSPALSAEAKKDESSDCIKNEEFVQFKIKIGYEIDSLKSSVREQRQLRLEDRKTIDQLNKKVSYLQGVIVNDKKEIIKRPARLLPAKILMYIINNDIVFFYNEFYINLFYFCIIIYI